MTSTLWQSFIFIPPPKPGVGVACRRLAVLQGYYECKSPLSYCCFVALVPVRCCVCCCSYWLSCALWLYVHASRVDTAAVYAAVSCAAFAVSVWLYIVRCAVMCDIELAPPLSPFLRRTRQRLILPYKIRWFLVISLSCVFCTSKAVWWLQKLLQ